MRQLLILAVDSPDALDVDHLAVYVPRLIKDARALGVLLAEPFKPRAIVDAAKDLCERLPTEQNVGIHPEMTRAECVTMGLRLLADMMPTLGDLDQLVRHEWNPK